MFNQLLLVGCQCYIHCQSIVTPVACADTIGYCNCQKANRQNDVENAQVVELNSHNTSRIMRMPSIHETHATVKPKRPAVKLRFPRKNGTTAPANATWPMHIQISESFSNCMSENSIVTQVTISLCTHHKLLLYLLPSSPTKILLHAQLLAHDQMVMRLLV